MSFSIRIVGKPDAIKRRLAFESTQLTGSSKAEFDAIKPAIEAVVDANLETTVISVNASGSAWLENGVRKQANCKLEVEPLAAFVE